jgi:hypothetical protein
MVREGREAIDEAIEATILPDVLADDLPWADRRLDERRPARHGAVAEIRRWGVGTRPDLAVQLVDLSISGIRVQLNRMVSSGERFEVTLWVPSRDWCIRCMGVVRWCILGADGVVVTGLRLSRPIAPRDFEALVGPTLTAGK